MKKFGLIILALIVIFAFIGCSDDDGDDDKDQTTTTTDTDGDNDDEVWGPVVFAGLTGSNEYVIGGWGIQRAVPASQMTISCLNNTLRMTLVSGQNRAINIQTGTAVGGTDYYCDPNGFEAVANTKYTVKFKAAVASGTGQVRIRGNNTGGWKSESLTTTAKNVTYTYTQTATGGNIQIDTGNTTSPGGIVIISALTIERADSSVPNDVVDDDPITLAPTSWGTAAVESITGLGTGKYVVYDGSAWNSVNAAGALTAKSNIEDAITATAALGVGASGTIGSLDNTKTYNVVKIVLLADGEELGPGGDEDNDEKDIIVDISGVSSGETISVLPGTGNATDKVTIYFFLDKDIDSASNDYDPKDEIDDSKSFTVDSASITYETGNSIADGAEGFAEEGSQLFIITDVSDQTKFELIVS